MAKKSSHPKLRYDDFIAAVQPDPTKPEASIMMAGYLGAGAEGHVRIYPDPTLGSWYDVPEDDVVHSLPIADSKLGGSYVWVRASAAIKPGSAAAAPGAAAMAGAPAAMAAHAQTNPPTLGCSGGCNALGMAQTFTQGLPCNHAALVGTQFTNYFGCTAACAQANAPPPSGTMHQCCGVQALGGFQTLQTFPPFTTRCLTMPAQCGVFNPFGQR